MAHNSYTMCIRGLPDMYTLSPRACGPRASGVHIRQTTHAHGITITYTMMSHTSKEFQGIYIYTHIHCECEFVYTYILTLVFLF